MSLIPLKLPRLTWCYSWTRNATEELSIFHNKINGLAILAGGVKFACDFTAISMDGKGSWRDNVFVERIWASVKYEEVYLRAYVSVGETLPKPARVTPIFGQTGGGYLGNGDGRGKGADFSLLGDSPPPLR